MKEYAEDQLIADIIERLRQAAKAKLRQLFDA
jgi:hypothetical protein